MRPLNALLLMCASFAGTAAHADPAADCKAGAGTYLAGVITSTPRFVPGRQRPHGVELSHTRMRVLADQDHRSYDVAIDNVFAQGAIANAQTIPASLTVLRPQMRVELCGALYKSGGPGVDWVHTNCGAAPTADHPNGFVRVIGADGRESDNLESNPNFCRLFKN